MKRQFSITAVALCVLAMPVLADDEEWSFKIGGLLHTDSVNFSDDLTPIESDTDFRRARLKTQARYGDWRIRADYEFGLAEGWRSTFVEYSGFRKQRIVVGNQVAPFSMEDLTGSRYLSLTERSIASALSPGMLLGASWRTWRDQWSFHAGVFGDELSDLDRRRLPGTSVVGRFTFAPVQTRESALHLGIAAEARSVDSGARVRLRARPGSRLTNVRLADTRSIDGVNDSTSLGLEAAWSYDRFKIQGEYTSLSLDGAPESFSFASNYVAASYLIGAEPYSYRASRGNFRRVKPESKWGALELTARVANLDLNDGSVEGGEHREVTFGVNYIFDRHLRLMLTHAQIDARPNRDGLDEDVSVTAIRLQLSL